MEENNMNTFIKFMLSILLMMMVTGCDEQGKVIQGRVIAYDKDSMQVTFIEDETQTPGKPEYTRLPPKVFKTPEDTNEMGADPVPGLRMKLDIENNSITIFDTATRQFKDIPYTLIDKKENVDKNDSVVKGRQFPIIDRTAGTIQIFSKRQKTLVTFSLPPEFFALPEETWASGDEIRIYYKEDGKALRLMNITKTDIFKK